MTKVTYCKNCLSVTNHANASQESGYDLVCCGISTIMYTCLAWFNQKDINIVVDNEKPSFTITLLKSTTTNQKLLNLAFKQIEALSKQYSKYIKVTKLK